MERKIAKKRLAAAGVLTLCLSVALLAGGCASSGGKQANQTPQSSSAKSPSQPAVLENKIIPVKVGFYGGTCEAPVYVAYEKGFFKQQGLDVELVKVNFDILKEGLASGKIDAVQVSPAMFKPIEQGLSIKLTNGVHTGCIQAVAAKGSAVQSLNDLKGKTIGVDAIGGVPMVILSVELSKLGINPKTDVTWKAFPSPQLVQALEKGEIHAFSTWDPFGELAINESKAQRIFTTTHSPEHKDYLCCFIGVSGKVATEKPEVAKAITEALKEASLWVGKNPQEAATLAIEKKYTGGNVEINGQLLKEYKFLPDTAKAKESLLFHLKNMSEQQILEKSTEPQKLANQIFLDVKK